VTGSRKYRGQGNELAPSSSSLQPITTSKRHQQIIKTIKMRITKAAGMKRSFVLPILLNLVFPNLSNAWNDKTHMAIAYIAYRNLNRHAKERVDEVLVLHPLYWQWKKDAKLGRAGLYAFMHAAAWPDCIQNNAKCPGYVADGTDDGMTPAVSQEAWQNTGFSDKFMHKYWHFIQRPYAAENRVAPEAQRPNIETQLQLLTEALNSNAGDTLKAYDLAWVENLVGELHQPLNCVSRFSAQHPAGDRNGREVKLCKAPCDNNLHDYWDNLLGTEDDFESAMKEGKSANLLPAFKTQRGGLTPSISANGLTTALKSRRTSLTHLQLWPQIPQQILRSRMKHITRRLFKRLLIRLF
jgi:hypothetical protein